MARDGGIARASERLHLIPQTISGQLSLLEGNFGAKLFNRVGRNLEFIEGRRLVLIFADETFLLGGELEEVIYRLPDVRPQLVRVGESSRDCRRLIFLRGLAYEQTTRIFKRSTRARSEIGFNQ